MPPFLISQVLSREYNEMEHILKLWKLDGVLISITVEMKRTHVYYQVLGCHHSRQGFSNFLMPTIPKYDDFEGPFNKMY